MYRHGVEAAEAVRPVASAHGTVLSRSCDGMPTCCGVFNRLPVNAAGIIDASRERLARGQRCDDAPLLSEI
jgi:hypothetical protein